MFDKGIEAVDGPWRESSVPYQCGPFDGRWENLTQDYIVVGVEINLGGECIQMFVQICSSIIAL